MTKDLVPARLRARLSQGQMLRVVRELQGLTQEALARASDLSQPAISAIERDEVALGPDRAVKLAKVLQVHPAVLVFPQWEVEAEPEISTYKMAAKSGRYRAAAKRAGPARAKTRTHRAAAKAK